MRKPFFLVICLSAIVLSAAQLKCKVCESDEKNKDCAVNPSEIKDTTCKPDEDRCIVEIVGKNTIRKCGKKDYCKEPGKNSATCNECEETADCGEIFPTNRPQCVQCSGKDCADDSKAPASSVCVNYDKDEKCYVVVKDDGNAYRGCMSDSDTKRCTEDDKICKKCPSSEKDCNKNSKQKYECIQCTGNDCKRPKNPGPTCALDVTTTESCEVLYGRDACYTFNNENEVTRGCVKSLNQTITKRVKKCTGDKCNNECVKDLQCPQCESTKDPDCLKDVYSKSQCPDYTSACHWCHDKAGNTHRGCGKGNKDFQCNYGYADDDPPKKLRSCYVCGADDPNCVTIQTSSTSKVCPKDDDDCVVAIKDKKTVRGCLSEVFPDVSKCTDKDNCKRCQSDNCNGEIYPVNRPQCVQCSGKDCADDSKAPASSVCFNYDKDEKCYVVVKDDGNAYRGCMSDSDTKRCTEDDKICKKCPSSEKDCNKNSKQKYECIKCTGNDCKRPKNPGPTCALDVKTTESCEVLYGRDACYTFNNENEVTRGCVKSLNQTTTRGVNKCTGDKCNSECIKDLQCPQCESTKDPECLKDPYKKSQCPDFTSTCHWCRDNGGNAYRGCGKGDEDLRCNYGYSDEEPAKMPKISCFVCDANDPNCATLGKNLTSEECPKDDDYCVVAIKDQKTVRGCLSTLFPDESKCTEKDNCKRCKSDNCNGNIYPEDRPQCVQCSGPNCVDDSKTPASSICVNYDKNDQCYVMIKNDKEAHRGCMSDQNSAVCTANDRLCKRCSDKDCNKNSKQKYECIQCTGNDCKRPKNPGPICAIDVKTTESCEVLYGRDACYTLKIENEVIRGCVKSLNQTITRGVNKCTGDKCNNECVKDLQCPQCRSTIDPDCLKDEYSKSQCLDYTSACHWCHDKGGNTHRGCGKGNKDFQCNYGYADDDPPKKLRSCYVCGADDPNCVTIQTSSTSKVCPKDDDDCVVAIKDKKTVRGCLSEVFPDVSKCTEKDNCKRCQSDKCNGEIYPVNRPQCVQCSGKDCADDSKAPASSVCFNYDKDEKCYVVVKDDGNAYRGCMSDSDTKRCTEDDKICKKCPSSEKNCNKNSKVTLECIKCAGNDCKRPKNPGPTCALDVKTTESCEVLYGRDACYTLNIENEVTRGCVKSLNQTITRGVNKCTGDKCNSKCIKDLECPQCESTKDPECLKDPYKKSQCPDFTSACHWCQDNEGNTHRGCGQGGKDFRCNYGYSDEDPAKMPKISCFVCDANDPNCATLQNALSTEECPRDDDECVVAIQDSKTVRGCLSKVFPDPTKCNEAGHCKRCKSSKCNGDIHPADRIRCYQCSRTPQCNSLSDEGIKPTPCALFNPADECYTNAEGSDVIRGCWSDTTKTCKDGDEKCVTCDNSDCNKEAFSRDATLKCMKCDKDKPECAWAQASASSVKCSQTVEYWQKETCFTYRHNETVVSRGCTLDADTCDNEDKCDKCEGDDCNKKNVVPFECYQCRSDGAGQEKCAETADGIQAKKCDKIEDIAYSDRGCFTRRDGKVVIRGCLAELTAEIRGKCNEKDSKECHTCLETGCNNKKAPNSSAMHKLSLVLLCLTVLIIFFK